MSRRIYIKKGAITFVSCIRDIFFTVLDMIPSSELNAGQEIAVALVFQVHGHEGHQSNAQHQGGKLFDRFAWFSFAQQIR